MKNFKIYFNPETFSTVKPKKEIELIGSLPDYEYQRETIYKKYHNLNMEPKRSSIKEFKRVHTDEYIDNIIKLSRDEKAEISISMECDQLYYFIPRFEYGLGGMYSIIDKMKEGILERAYCYSQPSHHSYPNKGHGYCLLNTMATSVRYAQSLGFQNILIIDWDHHHGDGTQTIFENDKTVHQISIHSAVDLYMGSVNAQLLGTTTYGEKVGHCNIPILDIHYNEAFVSGNSYLSSFKSSEEILNGRRAV